MKKIIVLLIFLLSLLPAREKLYNGFYCHQFLGVTDTDSFICDIIKPYPNTLLHPIMRNKIGIRIRGVEVADLKAKTRKEKRLALETETFLKTTLPAAESIRLENMGRDDSFKLLADVYVDGQNLKILLLAYRLACAKEDVAHLKRFKIKKFIKWKHGLICPLKPKSKKPKN